MKLNLNAVNQAIKDSVIYNEGKKVTSISLVLKGRVMVCNKGVKIIVGSGSFIGISDVTQEAYQLNYIAYDDVMLYTFDMQSINRLDIVLNGNKDYRGLLVFSLNKFIAEISKAYFELCQGANGLYQFFAGAYHKYRDIKQQYNIEFGSFIREEEKVRYSSQVTLDDRKTQHQMELAMIPLDAYKTFYGSSLDVSIYQIEEQVEIINQFITECVEVVRYIQDIFEDLISSEEDCLYKVAANTAIKIGNSHLAYNSLVSLVDDMIEEIVSIENLFDKRAGYKFMTDRTEMENIYYKIIMGKHTDEGKSLQQEEGYNDEEVLSFMKNSLKQILDYSGLDKEDCQEVESLIIKFRNLNDRLAITEEVRTLRRNISKYYYILYEKVFLRAYKESPGPRVVDMFLRYGFLDEKLLSSHHLLTLYRLPENEKSSELCQVYDIREWLTAVYEGKKEPSKNEFDMDYRTVIRTRKNRKEITEVQEREFYQDQEKKLEFEIQNMFQYNNRLVNGQMGSFVPFLYDEVFLNSVEKSLITPEKVNDVIRKLRDVDYSLFYREIMYSNESEGIRREFMMVEVFPDIILMPTHGINGLMWQDISEKRRSNSGRFLLPIFSDTDLFGMLLKTCGRFRWELCRTLQGTSWNDIKVKSLTSEYSDYLQFYRKNKDITEEKKEKLKNQIQKARNNGREIFTMDYEVWIRYESSGSIRLNKIVRELMSTYCPFSKEIRERISGQPIFEVAMVRFQRETKKKVREMELRLHALQKDKIEIPQGLQDTQKYYLEM